LSDADGRLIEVEAGWISAFNTAIAVSLDGKLVQESHPGRKIACPENDRAQAIATGGDTIGQAIGQGYQEGRGAPIDTGIDPDAWKRNRVPIAVDIALGLLFFVVAKLTDLSTAAIVGAAAGIGLIVLQRFVKVDLIGGLALFGVAMLLISAGLALAFQDDLAVKMRSTIVGTISAVLFLTDGLFGGRWLGRGMARYLPYTDVDIGRLAIGMGVLGLVTAGLNTAVALLASTDMWLFYTTFLDLPLIF
jgi:intracellular septation protein A